VRTLVLFLVTLGVSSASCVVQDLAPDGSVDGSLSADCRFNELVTSSRSTTYASGYRIKVTKPTVLTVRMSSTAVNPYLYLYTQAGLSLAANDDADGTADSRITISLNPGTYTLVATSRTTAAGTFTVAAASEAPRACPVRDASTTSGSFTDTGCRTLDLRPNSTDDRPVDRYRITATKRSVLTLELRSTEVDTYLELWDGAGARIDSDHAGAGDRFSRLVSSVEPGTYLVYAYPYRKATGGYSFAASTETPRTCTYKELAAGDKATPATVSGALTQESCRYLDLVAPSSDDTFVELYRVTLAKRAVVSLKQQSSAIDSYLIVTDSSFENIFENDDESGATANSAILGSLNAGTYIVIASESDAGAGTYSLSVAAEDPRACPTQDFSIGTTASASLETDACRWLDLIMESDDPTYVTPYRLTLSKPSAVAIDMKSTMMDAYLVVTTPSLKFVFGNDDGSEDSTDSRIFGSLEAGSYLILATTYEVETGPYTISATTEDLIPCPPKDLGRADSISGSLTDQSCRYLDLVVPSDDATPLDLYRLTVDTRGMLSLDMAATRFSPYLALTSTDFEFYYDNDGSNELKANLLVPPGTYYLLVNSFDDFGSYTLKTGFGPARDCPLPAIGLQDTQSATLGAGACRFSDFVPFTDVPVPANQHRVVVSERGVLKVQASSSDFAPALALANQDNLAFAALELNTAGAASAGVSVSLTPGTYNILVLTLAANGSGSYDLTTTFTRAGAGTQ
jgi:hypothetical protein